MLEEWELVDSRFYDMETIAIGHGIRDLSRLVRSYGGKNWRKRKGIARIRTVSGEKLAELHWYEAHGVGKVELKLKRTLR
jgi:hypothetical protein